MLGNNNLDNNLDFKSQIKLPNLPSNAVFLHPIKDRHFCQNITRKFLLYIAGIILLIILFILGVVATYIID